MTNACHVMVARLYTYIHTYMPNMLVGGVVVLGPHLTHKTLSVMTNERQPPYILIQYTKALTPGLKQILDKEKSPWKFLATLS